MANCGRGPASGEWAATQDAASHLIVERRETRVSWRMHNQTRGFRSQKIRRLQVMINMVMSVISQTRTSPSKKLQNWWPETNVLPSPCSPTKNSPTTSFTNLACNA